MPNEVASHVLMRHASDFPIYSTPPVDLKRTTSLMVPNCLVSPPANVTLSELVGRNPAAGFAAALPVSRQRRSQLMTELGLTSKCSATSSELTAAD
jgi:hypothetical protein